MSFIVIQASALLERKLPLQDLGRGCMLVEPPTEVMVAIQLHQCGGLMHCPALLLNWG